MNRLKGFLKKGGIRDVCMLLLDLAIIAIPCAVVGCTFALSDSNSKINETEDKYMSLYEAAEENYMDEKLAEIKEMENNGQITTDQKESLVENINPFMSMEEFITSSSDVTMEDKEEYANNISRSEKLLLAGGILAFPGVGATLASPFTLGLAVECVEDIIYDLKKEDENKERKCEREARV